MMYRAWHMVWIACLTGTAISGCSKAGSGAGTSAGTPAGPSAGVAADEPRTLNVFNWADFIEPAVITDFEREFGIHVNYSVYDSNEQLETILLTGHSNYDVVVPGGAFFERGVKAGFYKVLDKTRIPNLVGMDPAMNSGLSVYDPDNAHGVGYAWVTTGIGYDARRIDSRLADAPVKSWRMLYDPKIVEHFQDCGVSILDSPQDVVSSVLSYLGRDPNSEAATDLKDAERILATIRPYVRYIDATRYVGDLANGDICLAIGWSGDFAQARSRAKEAGKPIEIEFSIPVEGALSIFDVLAIPADAPHPQNAYVFINYLLRPSVAARNTDTTKYANGVVSSIPLIDAAVRNDPGVYPGAEARARLVPHRAHSAEFTRALTRMWTRFKTGQ